MDVVQDGGGARGTAGAVWDAAHLLHDRFLVVYGDTLFDVDLDRFWKAHAKVLHELLEHHVKEEEGEMFEELGEHFDEAQREGMAKMSRAA